MAAALLTPHEDHGDALQSLRHLLGVVASAARHGERHDALFAGDLPKHLDERGIARARPVVDRAPHPRPDIGAEARKLHDETFDVIRVDGDGRS